VDITGGYSGTPLVKKLGVKEGNSILIVNPPSDYVELVGGLPPNIHHALSGETEIDFIHYFETTLSSLEDKIFFLKEQLARNGMIWISWPKGGSGVDTDLNRDLIREFILQTELVDVKVCSVNEIWSGLKFVIRKELR